MKLPRELARGLARQWQQSSIRVERLLNPASWPRTFAIGKPSARTFAENIQAVQRHVEAWRHVQIGKVEWEHVSYRATLEPVLLPTGWCLHTPSEWIAAAGDPDVSREYELLEQLVGHVDPRFHALLVTQRSLWLNKPVGEAIATAQLATRLSPGCAHGRPLRLLAEHGVDTKFFERNATLLVRLLDELFEGEASALGLTTFLDAFENSSHWVLVVPLASGILPFKQLRLTTAELAETNLPCARVLVVENEHCIHQLPELPDTVAILGCGLDLQWLASPALANKTLGYWGDMDTWGLLMLARARLHQPNITALLMEQGVFDHYASMSAVAEPVTAQAQVPEGLTLSEAAFYQFLLGREKGRLEQEYLPGGVVREAVVGWGR